MGTIIEFPADAASRRPASFGDDGTGRAATVVILPVVRIERGEAGSSGDRGPEEGSAPGGRRRRR